MNLTHTMSKPTKFGTSKSWEKLGKHHQTILSQADGWNNFRRTIASRYFTDPDYSEADIRFAYDFLAKRGTTFKESDVEEGNPVRVVLDGKLVTQDLLISVSELASMEQAIDFKGIASFVEIGGGYGRMAHLLLQRYPHIEYTIVDVSPAIDVSKRFLHGKYKVKFISPSELQNLKAVDLFYSSSVLSELDFSIVNYYVDQINRIGTLFYLKDWKKGHHLNSLPPVWGFLLRAGNKLSKTFMGKDSKKIQNMIDAYRISEDTFPSRGWKEIFHRDCETITGYSPTLHKEKKFFETLYRIR